MKLVFLTSQQYPTNKVDPNYWKSIAMAFTKNSEIKFSFVIRGRIPAELNELNPISVMAPRRGRRIFYFLFFPILIYRYAWFGAQNIFFASDSYMLVILSFWKPIFKYRICSDWHQLFEDWRDRYIAKNSDFLITTSNRLRKLLVGKTEVDQGKVLVAYGGVDIGEFIEKRKYSSEHFRKLLNLPQKSLLVGYIGGFRSLGMEKGIDTMIESVPLLPQDIEMVFVGGSTAHITQYEKLASEHNVLNRCHFIEKQDFQKLVEYELSMDILVIPYPNKPHFRDYGFPQKVWEYLASGRFIIYSDLEIIDEVLRGKGRSFEAGSSRDLARKILEVKEGIKDYPLPTDRSWNSRAREIIDFIKK